MITPDGWFDWAERLPGNDWQTNFGKNTLRGLVAHSAEGYAATLLSPTSQYGYKGNHTWHVSNLFDGHFVQHFPVFARTWHGTVFNQACLGIENEGVNEPLTEHQINNLVKASLDVAAITGYKAFDRLTGFDDPAKFLLIEHKQAVIYGGSATACPSGRIPWAEILKRLAYPVRAYSMRLGGNHVWLKFAGSGEVPIADGDVWPLRVEGADFPAADYNIAY